MPRTNISVADEVADRLSAEAMKQNKTLYAFANESLDAVITVCRQGGDASEVVPSWTFGKIMKEVDAIPLPGDLVEKLLKKLYESDRDWLLGAWTSQGKRIGSYLQMGYPELSQLTDAAVEFKGLLPLKRIEVRTLEADGSRPRLLIRAVGAGQSAETTSCAERFMAGIAEAYQWGVKSSKVAEGMLELELTKERRP